MKEISENIWKFHKEGKLIVITTNGTIKANGEAVMGRGVALQAKGMFPKLPKLLGISLSQYGNIPFLFRMYNIATLPVKYHWQDKASLLLITQSCENLTKDVDILGIEEVYLVRPGCGNGGLEWTEVKPVIEPLLDDRFIIVENSR